MTHARVRSTVMVGTLLTLCVIAPRLSAQTVFGNDLTTPTVFEFAMAPAGPCPAPTNGVLLSWSYAFPAPCGLGPPGLPAGTAGDIAVDKVAGTVFVTDGIIIEEYAIGGPPPFPAPGTPVNAFFPPPILGLGPITGMGMDSAGGVLWLTDGALMAGVFPSPAGSCLAPAVAFPTFAPGFPGFGFFTDIDWDPFTATLWVSDIAAAVVPPGSSAVWNIIPGGALGPGGIAGSGFVPLAPGIVLGIAYDTATPGAFPNPPTGSSLFVSNASTGVVGWLDTTVGIPPIIPFYVGAGGTVAPAGLAGLAYALHGVNYGTSATGASIGSFGDSTTPSATFGLTLTGATPGDTVWIVGNFSFPGPGFLCPPGAAVGNTLWVDAVGAIILPLVPAPAGTLVIPTPIPSGVPAGINVFVQFFMDTSPGVPRGPWESSDALEFTVGAP